MRRHIRKISVTTAAKEPLMIEIYRDGKYVGKSTPDDFRKYVQAPKSFFLQKVIEDWNAWNKSKGLDLVAKIVIAK